MADIPSCFLCHNVLPHEYSLVDRLLLRYAFSSCQAFITHSREDSEHLKHIRPSTPVFINPHPSYDIFAHRTDLTEDQAKETLGLKGKNVLLFFGYIREYKGLPYLLDAMEELPLGKSYHLLVVGEFYQDRDIYQSTLDRLKEQHRLTLVDRYVPNEEVSLYFSAADILIVPYLTATQSGVIQIAYGFSKPVVATRVGGIPESVVDGQTGYLVPPGDAHAIASSVRNYFELNKKETFRRHILREKEKYSWDHLVDTVEKMAEKLKSEK